MPRPKADYSAASAFTAISRTVMAAPTRELIASGRIPKNASVFHQGPGQDEFSSGALKKAAREYAAYDPHHGPADRSVLDQRYDIVISNFVMNTLPPEDRVHAWTDVAQATGGTAYVTVRSVGDRSSQKGIRKHKDGLIMKHRKGETFQKFYTAMALVREAKKYFNKVEIIMGRRSGISWTVAASDPKIAGPGEPEAEVPQPAAARPVITQPEVDDALEGELRDIQRRAGIAS